MVILITGASHTGKTALAQKLLQKYQYLESSDHELTSYLWPIVREIIKTDIENKQNLIVEGCYIPFDREEENVPADNEEVIRQANEHRAGCILIEDKYDIQIDLGSVLPNRCSPQHN
ncbi:MAG: ATP-binding protein [Akkermansia sp.]|nr:ATP-binding protein [Akkermansia sp.]